MTNINVKVLQTDKHDIKVNYPHELLLWDEENLIGSYRKPLVLTYYEFKRLYDILKPIVELWETHNCLIHEKLQLGEITEEEALKQIKR